MYQLSLYAYYVLLLALLASPVVVAVYVDLRTRRGYGLALLALLLIGLAIWFLVAFEQAMRRSAGTDNLDLGIVFAVYLLLGCFCALALLIGALVEAGKAGQRRWVAGLIGAAVLPWLLVLVGSILDLGGIWGGIAFGIILGLPILAVLAYGVSRCVRPVPRAAPRQVAPAR